RNPARPCSKHAGNRARPTWATADLPGNTIVNLNRLRLKAVWLLVVPFLWLCRPTLELVLIGASIAGAGLLLRAWAAGTIHKEEDLTTSGPYAFTRNPLYLGSFLIGIG